ncbi:MAG: MupG family TIM beta-alpha barrel fold protein [Atopobiaceae bacterium]|jgi:hypothetical protein|nr:MupG family TIM beta-alpha barrel fold protein [Atopobiaceae bacterium]
MHKLGISIYPENSTPEKDAAYIEAAAQHGFTRVFSCLLSANAPKERVMSEFTALDDLAHENGMEVCLDVAPSTFEKLGIDYSDLSFFSEVHADAIRLDEAFDAAAVAEMTRNPQGLSIELNASTCDGTLDAVMRHDPNTDRLMACHNYYPQRFSGLGLERFMESSREVKRYGLELAAFISAPDRTAFGPWPVRNGLCTLECHRGMPMSLQARHLFALGLIDDVMVANCFPSEKGPRGPRLGRPLTDHVPRGARGRPDRGREGHHARLSSHGPRRLLGLRGQEHAVPHRLRRRRHRAPQHA